MSASDPGAEDFKQAQVSLVSGLNRPSFNLVDLREIRFERTLHSIAFSPSGERPESTNSTIESKTHAKQISLHIVTRGRNVGLF